MEIAVPLVVFGQGLDRRMARHLDGRFGRDERHETRADLDGGGPCLRIERDGRAVLGRDAQVDPETESPFAEARRVPSSDDRERIDLVVTPIERGPGVAELERNLRRIERVSAEHDPFPWREQRGPARAARVAHGCQPDAERQEDHFGRAVRPGGPGPGGRYRRVAEHVGRLFWGQSAISTEWAGDQARTTRLPGSTVGSSRFWEKTLISAPSVPPQQVGRGRAGVDDLAQGGLDGIAAGRRR